jgi:hypothetical protein
MSARPIGQETSRALRRVQGRMHRAIVSLAATGVDARALGPEWEWLANDLRASAEKVTALLKHARSKVQP